MGREWRRPQYFILFYQQSPQKIWPRFLLIKKQNFANINNTNTLLLFPLEGEEGIIIRDLTSNKRVNNDDDGDGWRATLIRVLGSKMIRKGEKQEQQGKERNYTTIFQHSRGQHSRKYLANIYLHCFLDCYENDQIFSPLSKECNPPLPLVIFQKF
uniref:Uncharacterized protein n=1 Tax=Cacopsylla melanoneura TaxID=428564 RepID=A0A8D8W3R0_9HEMI